MNMSSRMMCERTTRSECLENKLIAQITCTFQDTPANLAYAYAQYNAEKRQVATPLQSTVVQVGRDSSCICRRRSHWKALGEGTFWGSRSLVIQLTTSSPHHNDTRTTAAKCRLHQTALRDRIPHPKIRMRSQMPVHKNPTFLSLLHRP